MAMKPLVVCAAACAAVSFLSGCGSGTISAPSMSNSAVFHGSLHGGQSPVVGAHVHIMAVGATGNGAASVSMLTTGIDGTDSIGGYVLTKGDGSFSITGDYSCTTGQYGYALATEGNPGQPGTVNNTAIGEMALIGACGVPDPSYFISINEVTTVTAAYALSGFGTSPTQIAYSGSALGQTGLANAFATDGNLQTGGVALAKTPAGNGTVPQGQINSLANVLSACINTTSSSSPACTMLFDSARANGTTGTRPTNTAEAMFNIAKNPGTVDIATMLTIPSGVVPFQPTLGSTVPTDLTLQVVYTGHGLTDPYVPSIDKNGNVWVPNNNGNLVELSPVGAPLSGASGFSNNGSAMVGTGSVVDLLGNVWVTNGGSIEKFSSDGTHLLTASGGNPAATYFNRLVSDASSNIWMVVNPNALGKYANDGTALTPSSGVNGESYNMHLTIDSTGTLWNVDKDGFLRKLDSNGNDLADYADGDYGLLSPSSAATDSAANTWVTNYNDNTLAHFTSAGVLSVYSGGGLSGPYWVALDGAGDPWVTNLNNGSISAFTSTGAAITPSSGYAIPAVNGSFALCAVDGSGNLWITEEQQRALIEVVGVAVPVVTPITPSALAQRP
jgi:hypothetical protein